MPWPRSRIGQPSPGLASDHMAIKVILLFLIGMAVLGMFGKLRFPGQDHIASAKCKSCGRYRIGKGPCACGKDRR